MRHVITWLMVFGLFVVVIGCSESIQSPPTTQSASPTMKAGHGDHEHGEHEHGAENAMTDMDKMKAELAKLSSEDAASAEKQHICPVSGDMLGTMGPPLKIEVNGQQVWICCEGCEADLLADPEQYLAKLKKGTPHE